MRDPWGSAEAVSSICRASPCRFGPGQRHRIGTDFAPFRFLFAQKSVTHAVVPSLSRKVTFAAVMPL